MNKFFVTIFTSTYNRHYTIDRLYHSLLRQTQNNFEWLVIDDGSTDDTEKYFCSLISKPQPFQIRYIKQENGGKHRAINKGVNIANGALFFIVDSDDYLAENAIDKINQWVTSLDNSHKWAGVSGLRGFQNNNPIGKTGLSKKYTDAKHSELKKKNLIGDKAQVYFTDILRKYPFPEIEGENFITEEIVWNAIARENYFIRWFPQIIYITEYLEDGLTHNFELLNKKNPKGLCLWAKGQLATYPHNIIEKMLAIRCYYLATQNNLSNKDISSNLGISTSFLYITIFAAKFAKLFHKTKSIFFNN